MNKDEKNRLDSIAGDSKYAAGINTQTILHSFEIFRRFIRGDTILELGCAEGVMTDLLVKIGLELSVVEGAASFCEAIRKRHPGVEVHNNLFEEFSPNKQYDSIILGHVLEHVDNPVEICARALEWLTPDGRLMAAVPNARSLHRQAAVLMGLLDAEDALNDMDRHHGHRRVFNPESFRNVFLQAGFNIEVFGGYWIKPVSNSQIEQDWTPEMINAFMQLGERYPDIAAELYVIAQKP